MHRLNPHLLLLAACFLAVACDDGGNPVQTDTSAAEVADEQGGDLADDVTLADLDAIDAVEADTAAPPQDLVEELVFTTEPTLPSATGRCPDFVQGMVRFAPAGLATARDTKVWISDAAATLDGPLVFYWHGAGGHPDDTTNALSSAVIDAILTQGGIVVAPYSDPTAGQLPWFLSSGGSRTDDLVVADEIVACAVAKVGIDVKRIHATGMSAGGLHTAYMSYLRSNYIASVVTYSGGFVPFMALPKAQDRDNLFAALVYFGGPNDSYIINFQDSSEAYSDQLRRDDHFHALCDHGLGHRLPADARLSTWQFFQDHPFGTVPSPYADGLPSGLPAYCEIVQ